MSNGCFSIKNTFSILPDTVQVPLKEFGLFLNSYINTLIVIVANELPNTYFYTVFGLFKHFPHQQQGRNGFCYDGHTVKQSRISAIDRA